jgi:hypothetical protein
MCWGVLGFLGFDRGYLVLYNEETDNKMFKNLDNLTDLTTLVK